MSRPFAARFPGRCGACDERVHIDDLVRFDEDQIVHSDCEASAPQPERPVVVCERCWLAKPCGCDD